MFCLPNILHKMFPCQICCCTDYDPFVNVLCSSTSIVEPIIIDFLQSGQWLFFSNSKVLCLDFGCHWKPNTHQFPKARKESLDLEIDICGRRDISYHVIPHKLKARIYQPSSQRTGLKSQPPVRSRECPCLRKDVRGSGSVQQEGKVRLHCPLPLGQVSSIFLIGVISLIFFFQATHEDG